MTDQIKAPQPAQVPAGFALIPLESSDALLRPFYECPPEELKLAWQAMHMIAKKMHPAPAIQAPECDVRNALAELLDECISSYQAGTLPKSISWDRLIAAQSALAAPAPQAAPDLDLRNDMIATLRGQLADLQALCDERGRKLYGDDDQSPAEGAGMLKPLIYAAMMHNGKPKTVAEFERAAANVADMLQRRAEVTHNKPVASIYISDDGSREFDDWRVDLPPGNHQLFTAPRPDQPQPESLPHPGAPEAEEMIEKLLVEYNRPSNMKNAARAGYMAAKRLLQNARQPLPATDDAEPNVQPKGTQAALKAQALALCHALEEQPGSQYQTAAVLAAFKVYRAFESIEKHGEIRQWVFDVAAPATQAPAPAPEPACTRVTGRELNRFSIQGASIYDHLDQADVLIRVDGDWESEADRDQYVNALAARLQAPAVAPVLARAKAEWHEDDGPALWWAWNGRGWAGEAAWIGTPLDDDWPGYHTHWSAHPAQPTTGAKQ